jgi:hypothetical protein
MRNAVAAVGTGKTYSTQTQGHIMKRVKSAMADAFAGFRIADYDERRRIIGRSMSYSKPDGDFDIHLTGYAV